MHNYEQPNLFICPECLLVIDHYSSWSPDYLFEYLNDWYFCNIVARQGVGEGGGLGAGVM